MIKLHADYDRCNFLIFYMWKLSCVASLAERRRVLSNAQLLFAGHKGPTRVDSYVMSSLGILPSSNSAVLGFLMQKQLVTPFSMSGMWSVASRSTGSMTSMECVLSSGLWTHIFGASLMTKLFTRHCIGHTRWGYPSDDNRLSDGRPRYKPCQKWGVICDSTQYDGEFHRPESR